MKRIIIALSLVFVGTTTFAQQNLGVNQTNPTAKTHITNTENQNSLRVDDEAGDATPTVIDADGNMGVGVATPAEKLEVQGNIKANGNVLDQNGFVNPSGVVQAYVGTSAPQGWLLCDGSEVSRVTYANLFAIVGTSFGSGDGSTTFHLPDMRGQFMRGADNGAGNDPDAATRTAANAGGNTGDAVGSIQSDEFSEHNHGGGNHNHSAPNSGYFVYNTGSPNWDLSSTNGEVNTASNTPNSGVIIDNDGGNETRPVNIAFNYIIKY